MSPVGERPYRDRVESGRAVDRALRIVEVLFVISGCAITVPEIAIDVPGPLRWPNAVIFGAAITFPLLARRHAPLAAASSVAAAASVNVAVNGESAGGPGPWL